MWRMGSHEFNVTIGTLFVVCVCVVYKTYGLSSNLKFSKNRNGINHSIDGFRFYFINII